MLNVCLCFCSFLGLLDCWPEQWPQEMQRRSMTTMRVTGWVWTRWTQWLLTAHHRNVHPWRSSGAMWCSSSCCIWLPSTLSFSSLKPWPWHLCGVSQHSCIFHFWFHMWGVSSCSSTLYIFFIIYFFFCFFFSVINTNVSNLLCLCHAEDITISACHKVKLAHWFPLETCSTLLMLLKLNCVDRGLFVVVFHPLLAMSVVLL